MCFYAIRADMPRNVLALKTGLLCAVLCVILEALVRSAGDPPLLPVLCNLRRRLLLGNVTVTTATKEFDVAMNGIHASDVTQMYLARFLSIADSIRSVNARTAAKARDKHADFMSFRDPSPAERMKAREAICGLCREYHRSTKDLLDSFTKAFSSVKWRLALVASIVSGPMATAKSIVDETFAHIQALLDGIQKECANSEGDLNRLIASLSPDGLGCALTPDKESSKVCVNQ